MLIKYQEDLKKIKNEGVDPFALFIKPETKKYTDFIIDEYIAPFITIMRGGITLEGTTAFVHSQEDLWVTARDSCIIALSGRISVYGENRVYAVDPDAIININGNIKLYTPSLNSKPIQYINKGNWEIQKNIDPEIKIVTSQTEWDAVIPNAHRIILIDAGKNEIELNTWKSTYLIQRSGYTRVSDYLTLYVYGGTVESFSTSTVVAVAKTLDTDLCVNLKGGTVYQYGGKLNVTYGVFKAPFLTELNIYSPDFIRGIGGVIFLNDYTKKTMQF